MRNPKVAPAIAPPRADSSPRHRTTRARRIPNGTWDNAIQPKAGGVFMMLRLMMLVRKKLAKTTPYSTPPITAIVSMPANAANMNRFVMEGLPGPDAGQFISAERTNQRPPGSVVFEFTDHRRR